MADNMQQELANCDQNLAKSKFDPQKIRESELF